MYPHHPSSSSSSPSSSSYHDPFLHLPIQSSPPTYNHHISPPHGGFFDAGPYSSSFSLPSSYMQRSSSALSLQKQLLDNTDSPFLEQPDQLFDFQAGPMRRVFSAGDIKPLGDNCSSQEGVAAAATAGRVGRYTAEERKERIDRYRTKRSHRNFHKKITYACRKTLADSRPRVRGRFARNGEPAEGETETEPDTGEANSCNYMQSDGGGGCYGGWTQVAGAATDEDEDYYSGNELWTNFLDVFSMNNLIS